MIRGEARCSQFAIFTTETSSWTFLDNHKRPTPLRTRGPPADDSRCPNFFVFREPIRRVRALTSLQSINQSKRRQSCSAASHVQDCHLPRCASSLSHQPHKAWAKVHPSKWVRIQGPNHKRTV